MKLWPGLPFLGLGVWLAWTVLAYGGTVWLSGLETDGRFVSYMHLLSTASFAIVLFVAPFFSDRLELLLARRGFVYLFGALASAGSIGIVVSGSAYLSNIYLFYFGAVLTGIGTAIIALRCGLLYGRLAPNKVIIYAMLSQFLVAFIFFIVLGGERILVQVSTASSLPGLLAFILLPILAAILVAVVPPEDGSGKSAPSFPPLKEPKKGNSKIASIPGSFWKFCVTIFIFTMVTSVVRGFAVHVGTPSTTLAETSILMFLRIAFAICFLYLALRIIKHINFGRLYFLLIVGVAVVVTVCSSFQLYGLAFNVFVKFSLDVFSLVLWCLLAFIAYQKRMHPLVVFGFGRGSFMAGNALGWVIGAWVMPAETQIIMNSFILLFLALAVLISSVLVFSVKDFDNLFLPISKKVFLLEDLMAQHEAALPQEVATHSGEPLYPPRPYIAACKRVGSAAHLSAREQDVFELLAQGRDNDNIAARLNISSNTSRTHAHNIYAKLKVHSRRELIALVEEEWKSSL
ncbi:MAG: LuxR C-terminal-related transcriptional regulator [Coriobacteriia bacterium]|nr:LuxR C-terminal-related transcriptional regulator [Coriobacteriia bacterium]